MLKIVTLPFDDKMEEFEQEKLEKVLKDVQIVKYQAELVKIEGKYYWTVFVECQKIEKLNKNSEKNNFTENGKEFKDANKNYMEYLTEDEMELYKILKEWRAGEAQLLGYPPYIIASNQLLANIAKTNPKNMEELSQLKGMGKRKIRDYGEEILLILENFYDMLKPL
ncbi:HRDC domain-containing protein [Leptotrichia massiliensis]|uniref:HRDC domain-containing protein n=1 Tax=Leptotrichia massiliensis TaxID=1852388 RepID=UPI0028D19BCE|nr:HRDC domain-containing protein [Leptotrichia massiliensis]